MKKWENVTQEEALAARRDRRRAKNNMQDRWWVYKDSTGEVHTRKGNHPPFNTNWWGPFDQEEAYSFAYDLETDMG